jgi:hypothetical protein
MLLSAAAVSLAIWGLASLADQRDQSILRECTAQNFRHDATIAELNQELSTFSAKATAAQRKQLAASREFTILLIDRLAPFQDCKAVLRANTQN